MTAAPAAKDTALNQAGAKLHGKHQSRPKRETLHLIVRCEEDAQMHQIEALKERMILTLTCKLRRVSKHAHSAAHTRSFRVDQLHPLVHLEKTTGQS